MDVAVDLGNAPEWGSVVVAVAAAVYAGWSRREARRSADAAEETLRQQQAPEYTAEVENPNGDVKGHNGWHRLMVRVVKSSAGALDELRVELLTDGVHFTPGQYGVAPAPHPGSSRQYTAVHAYEHMNPASIDVGERAHWRIEFDDHEDQLPAIEQVEIRVTAVHNGKPWVTALRAPVQARLTHKNHLEQQALTQRRMADELDRAIRQGVWKRSGPEYGPDEYY